MFEPLPDDLATALRRAKDRIGRSGPVRFATEIGSTNDEAIALAGAGAPDGTAVLALSQRAGRGRRGRTWFSPPDSGVYLSVVVHIGTDVTLPLVTLAAGVAAASAVLTASGLQLELKWPNDLVVGQPWRKLGGLLCESVGGPPVKTVVVGIGINRGLQSFPPELASAATSLEAELGRPVDRGLLVAECLVELRAWMTRMRSGQDDAICQQWRRLGAGGFGARVRWHDQGKERTGVAKDIDRDGALVVHTDRGLERVIAGEVTWDRRLRA